MEPSKVRKRDGRITSFSKNKIVNAIYKAFLSVGKDDKEKVEKVADQVVKELEKEYDGRVVGVEEIQDVVEQTLIKNNLANVAKSYILYRQRRKEVREEKKKILNRDEIDDIDKRFDLNALKVLAARYLKKDENDKIVESPKELFERVAIHVALPSILYDERIFDKNCNQKEKDYVEFDPISVKIKIGEYYLNKYHLEALKRLYDRLNKNKQMKVGWKKFISLLEKGEFDCYEKEIREYFDLMTEKKFLPNTPALVNFGRTLGMGSACFVISVTDSIEGIMDGLKKASVVFKSGGGVGYNFSNLRPEGDIVKSTSGEASGPISFMTLYDKMTEVIKQGGVRRGANMGILNSDHPDIEKFIVAKRKNIGLRNFNISVFIKPDFWEYYKKGEPYPLVNPRSKKVVKYIDPRNLIELIAYQSWESAEPGIIFGDNVNKYNPFLEYLGPIETTNPCLTSDTWIATSKGPRQVRELIEKNPKIVVNGKEYRSKGFFFTGKKDIYKLVTKEGFEICLTGNHLVKKVTKSTRWKIETDWKEAGKLKKNDKLVLNLNNFGWKGKHNERDGYLVGHLIGNGAWKDKVFLQSWGESKAEKKVRELIKRYVNYSHRSDFKGWIYNSKSKRYRLTTSSLNKLAKELKIRKKEITKEIEKESSDFYKGFLRGLFDTDGSVQGNQNKGISIRLAQSNLEILKGVQRMLLRLGIFSKIYKNRRKASYSKLPDGKGGHKLYKIKPQHELVISCENVLNFYKRIGFANSDKMNKLEALLKKYKKKLDKEKFLVTVEKIIKVGEKKVYDLQVPGINAFDANGFYVHNCGEVLLYPYESCNLGSINVCAFTYEEDGKTKFNFEEFKRAVHLATRFLDNVIDINKYPLPEIEEKTLKTRKIGLGIMGLADLLFNLEIPYHSKEGLEFTEKIMEFLNYHSKIASIELGKQRGAFTFYDKSFYKKGRLPFSGERNLNWKEVVKKIKEIGIRNSFTIVIAPTGSISMIAGCSSGVEPNFSLIYEKKVAIGTFYHINPIFEKTMRKKGLFNDKLVKEIGENNGSLQNLDVPEKFKKVFVIATDLKAKDHIKMLATVTKYTDSSVSKTINLPREASVEDVRKAILLAHKLGCKDITVFRQGSIQGVYEVNPEPKKEASTYEAAKNKDICPNCSKKLVNEEGCKTCKSCGYSVCE